MSQANLPNMTAGLFNAFAFETITVSDTAIGFTTATLSDSDGNAKRVFVTVEDAQIRYNYEGSTPTSTVGHIANPGSIIILSTTSAITNFRAIRTGSNDGKLQVTFEH